MCCLPPTVHWHFAAARAAKEPPPSLFGLLLPSVKTTGFVLPGDFGNSCTWSVYVLSVSHLPHEWSPPPNRKRPAAAVLWKQQSVVNCAYFAVDA